MPQWLRSHAGPMLSIALWIYALGIALVLPWGATPGSESSWQAALGEAARQHLVFGRDVAYTYGPLGYLAVGSALPDTYAAKTLAAVIIAALLASVLVVRASSEGKPWQKVAFAAGSVIAAGTVVQVTTIDILLYFTFGLALTHPAIANKRSRSWILLALGLFAGIVGLVKFSYCVGFFVAGAVALLAMADAEGLATYVVAFVLACAGIYACVTFGLWPWVVPPFAGTAALALRRRIGALGFALAGICAIVAAANSPYLHFLVRSFREASEYSAGMAVDGSARDLLVGLAVLAVVLAVAVRERAALGVARVGAIVVLLALIFKEGFVRQDTGHLAVFFCGAALLGCVVVLTARLRYSAIAAVLVTAFALSTSVLLVASANDGNVLGRDLPTPVALNLRDAFVAALDWRRRALEFQQGYAAALAPDDLPANVVAKLRTHPVDLVGSEENVVFANGLQWKPEPVFQPRNAYLPSLDALDRDSLRLPATRRELVAYASVDDRYPLGDQPFTYRELICRGVPVPGIAQPVTTSSREDSFVVLQPSKQRCGPERIADAGTVGFGEAITVAPARGKISFLIADFHYTLLGLIVKTLYHVPAVNLDIDYADGSNESFRIVPAVARDGMLIDPVPKSIESLASLFAGVPYDRVIAVQFSTGAPWCFIDRIGYRLTTVSYAKVR